MTCAVVIYQDDQTALLVAECPEFGVASQGSAEDQAMVNVKKAVELYLEAFPQIWPRKATAPLQTGRCLKPFENSRLVHSSPSEQLQFEIDTKFRLLLASGIFFAFPLPKNRASLSTSDVVFLKSDCCSYHDHHHRQPIHGLKPERTPRSGVSMDASLPDFGG